MTNKARKTPGLKKNWSQLRNKKVQAVSASPADLVEIGQLPGYGELPILIEPKLRSVDLCAWVRANRKLIEDRLLQTGGILFRGFDVHGAEDFSKFIDATGIELMYYREGATPRSQIEGKVYTSTEFPPDQSIALHNELNYVVTWPRKIWFCCDIEPPVGGETPIADVRRVFERLAPEIRDEFVAKGWMLVRNFGEGFGPDWRKSYRVESREELEEYLRSAQVDYEWKPSGGLRTRQVRPAIARHPETGETLWFNHVAFWHVSSLEDSVREAFLEEYEEDEFPYSTYYGDGTRIPDEVAAALRAAYDAETVAFKWRKGDILMLDNMLVAHGRKPFEGDRLILTAMGQATSDRGLEKQAA